MSSGSQYRPDRRIEAIPKLGRIEVGDPESKSELAQDGLFHIELERTAAALKERKSKRTFAQAQAEAAAAAVSTEKNKR